MTQPIVGVQNKWSIKQETTPGTAVTPTTLLETLEGSDLGMVEEAVDTEGMSGTREGISERTRAGNQRISGRLVCEPNAAEWAVLLPLILGADASGTTFALAETLPAFTAELKKDNGTDGKVFTYAGNYMGKATITAEEGRPVRLECDIEGMTETPGNAGTATSLSLNVATSPFLLSDSNAAISVAGSAYPAKRIQIEIDNVLDANRFNNKVTRTAIPTLNRIITVTLDHPYGDATAIYPTAATLAAGVAVSITFTNTIFAVSMLLSFVKVHFPRHTPPLNGRNEIMLPLSGRAKKAGSTASLVVTLDSTP